MLGPKGSIKTYQQNIYQSLLTKYVIFKRGVTMKIVWFQRRCKMYKNKVKYYQ